MQSEGVSIFFDMMSTTATIVKEGALGRMGQPEQIDIQGDKMAGITKRQALAKGMALGAIGVAAFASLCGAAQANTDTGA